MRFIPTGFRRKVAERQNWIAEWIWRQESQRTAQATDGDGRWTRAETPRAGSRREIDTFDLYGHFMLVFMFFNAVFILFLYSFFPSQKLEYEVHIIVSWSALEIDALTGISALVSDLLWFQRAMKNYVSSHKLLLRRKRSPRTADIVAA